MKEVDYDQRLHAIFAAAAAMSASTMAGGMSAFAARLPDRRPLALADVGSGTGRFSTSLADTFGGPVLGIEPSDRMRAVADRDARHNRVTYQSGRCEELPLEDGVMDGALLYGVWHHVRDKALGDGELFRVVRRGGRLLLRTTSSDRMPDLLWYEYFGRAREVDRSMCQPLPATVATLGAAGWEFVTVDEITAADAQTRGEDFRRLQSRVCSTFEHLTEAEVDEGFKRIEHALVTSADHEVPPTASDLVVFAKP